VSNLTVSGEKPAQPPDGEIPAWFWVATACLFGLAVLILLQPIWDIDEFWHVKVGELIATTHAIPRTDPFTWTRAGTAWTTHEWLSEVLYYLAFRSAGWNGVRALGGIAVLLGFGLLLRFAWKQSRNVLSVLLVVALVLLLYIDRMRPRPHVIAFPCEVAFAALLFAPPDRRRTAAALGVAVLWANLHGGAVLAPALAIAAALARRNRSAAILAGAAVLAVACNPAGLGIYREALATRDITQAANVSEWAPVWRYLQVPDYTLHNLVAVIAPFAAIAALLVRFLFRPRPDLGATAVAMAAAVVSASAGRHIYLVFPAAVLLASGTSQSRGRLRQRPAAVAMLVAAVALGLSSYAYGVGSLQGGLRKALANARQPIRAGEFPERMAGFLARAQLGGRMWNSVDWGGYLIFHLWPGYQVFMDGRTTLFPPEIHELGHRAFASGAAPSFLPSVEADFDRLGVTVIVSKRPFFPEGIWDRRRWMPVYRDDQAEVFLRRGAIDETAMLRAYQAAGLGPDPAQPELDLLAASGAAVYRALAPSLPPGDDPGALLRAGLLEVEFGLPEKGEPFLRRAQNLGSQEPALGYALAKCLFRMDRTPEALALAGSWPLRDRRLDRLAARLREVTSDP
jgi:hypothetical protein